ncbi:MAG TPA: spore maturation protein [Papillibacter sp.]|jgi:spore maturation protein B|nr:spore maturation protein [Papillibacter sp.]
MNIAMSLVAPAILALAAVYGLHRQVDVFDALKTGAYEGLLITTKILPTLVVLLTGVYMLRASGALDALTALLAPALQFLGIPPETAPLVFIRPVSGSGALAVGSELITQNGADSLVGRTAAVMLGSTETTFYVIAVYFGAAGIKKSRYTIPAALTADLAGYIAASLAVRLLYK